MGMKAACGRSSFAEEEGKAQAPTKEALEEQVAYLESLLKSAKANLERFGKSGE